MYVPRWSYFIFVCVTATQDKEIYRTLGYVVVLSVELSRCGWRRSGCTKCMVSLLTSAKSKWRTACKYKIIQYVLHTFTPHLSTHLHMLCSDIIIFPCKGTQRIRYTIRHTLESEHLSVSNEQNEKNSAYNVKTTTYNMIWILEHHPNYFWWSDN